jgi:hypothetical protein
MHLMVCAGVECARDADETQLLPVCPVRFGALTCGAPHFFGVLPAPLHRRLEQQCAV